MSGFNLADYEPVEERLAKFWADHPKGRVITELLSHEDDEFIVKATVYRDEYLVEMREELGLVEVAPSATGLAHEVVGGTAVNRTSALENCETSAIGRALANLGYAPKGQRPSREEMEKATRESAPPKPKPEAWLAEKVEVFGLWTPDQRRDAYKTAITGLGFPKLRSQGDAKHVFEAMEVLYYEAFPDVAPM